MTYHVAEGSAQSGPFTVEQLAARGGLAPDTLVWCEGMPTWAAAHMVPALQPVLRAAPMAYASPVAYASPMPPYAMPPMPENLSGIRIAAGICGILFGTLGIHKFIAGLTGGAVTMLAIAVGAIILTPFTCGMSGVLAIPVLHVIGIIEGIIYLTKTDAAFFRDYTIGKRQWF